MTEASHYYLFGAAVLIMVVGFFVWRHFKNKKTNPDFTDSISVDPDRRSTQHNEEEAYDYRVVESSDEPSTNTADDESANNNIGNNIMSNDNDSKPVATDDVAKNENNAQASDAAASPGYSWHDMIRASVDQLTQVLDDYREKRKAAKADVEEAQAVLERAQVVLAEAQKRKIDLDKSVGCANKNLNEFVNKNGNGDVTSCCTDS